MADTQEMSNVNNGQSETQNDTQNNTSVSVEQVTVTETHTVQATTQQPVQTQPGSNAPPGGGQWMQVPENIVNCPPGLEYLTQVDQLLVQQKVELLEAFTGFETNNKYEVTNTMGQRVYYAAEETGCCGRMCCGSRRGYTMRLLDNYGKEVIHMHRGLRCETCWCPLCLQKVEVEAPPGNTIGFVRQAWSLCRPEFKINNANDETVLRVRGPCITCNMCMADIVFEVFTEKDDVQIGEIRKAWSGLVKEAYTDADNFGVNFPLDLDVHVKATLLATVFLMDFMYWEHSPSTDDKKGITH